MRKEQDIKEKGIFFLKKTIIVIEIKTDIIEANQQKTTIDKLNNPVHRKKDSELEGITEKITQNAEQREKAIKKSEGKLKDVKIRIKLSKTHQL